MVKRRSKRPSARPALSRSDLRKRAGEIRLVITDSDGVLTDTGVYYGAAGESFKRFSIRDGMGVRLLRAEGIDTAIITGETSPSVRQRAEKLRIRLTYLGVDDKAQRLQTILAATRLGMHQVAYIGDDVNDLGIIRALQEHGLTAAPADAVPSVVKEVHFRCTKDGGKGAFREFADWILQLRQKKNAPGSRNEQLPEQRPTTLKVTA
jgi:3-deoxy-D-manno-octulosonate 8-phosphate phosphatase (KDO 8-P phosphatase)